MTLRSIVGVLCSAILASCQPDSGSPTFRGAGVQLDTRRAVATTRNLLAYIDTMCRNAGISDAAGGCPARIDQDNYSILLQAGLGEINLGCRSYVQFVFEQRSQGEQFKSSTSAVQAFLSGIFSIEGGGARLFSYLILGSTAANAFYDISSVDPLRGMTPSNILLIVTERQRTFESALVGKKITSTPQLFRVWHEYQWLCSPLSISSDFNTLAVAAIEGRKVDFRTDAQVLADSITGTRQAVSKFDENAGLKKQKSPAPLPNAVGPVENTLVPKQVGDIQEALCAKRSETLDVGTRGLINDWRRAVTTTARMTEGLTKEESDYLIKESSCRELGYRSWYERAVFYDSPVFAQNSTDALVVAKRASEYERLMKYLKLNSTPGTVRFTSPIRNAITEKQKELKVAPTGIIDEAFYRAIPD